LASKLVRILCGGRALEHVFFEDINIYSLFLLFKILSTVDVHDNFLQEIGIFFVKSFISPISVSNFSGSQ
jgi:hypothetical protein